MNMSVFSGMSLVEEMPKNTSVTSHENLQVVNLARVQVLNVNTHMSHSRFKIIIIFKNPTSN